MRVHLFEFEDLEWFPDTIREGMVDFLRYLFQVLKYYNPVVPLLKDALEKTKQNQLLDLGSGGGGAIELIHKDLEESMQKNIKITLSDKYPNINAFEYIKQKSNGKIDYAVNSVDAWNVAKDLKGFRTLFTVCHHFKPDTVKAIIKDAVDNKTGIAIFDGGDKNLLTILMIILLQPIGFLIATPFFRPFRFSRILFTYIIPLIPICTVWDGIISTLRLYHPKELLKFAEEIDAKNYVWKAGKVRNKFGLHVTYHIGYPINQ